MGKRSTGIKKDKNGNWVIDKVVAGQRIFRRTGTPDLQIVETLLTQLENEIRRAALLGQRRNRSFKEAALRYVKEHAHKRSIERDVTAIKQATPYIGELPLHRIYDETLEPLKQGLALKGAKKKEGLKARSINIVLWTVSRILTLAAKKWRDENGLTWLETAPLISHLPTKDARKPYPLSWAEQRLLFEELSPHMAPMITVLLNTGARDQEICKLRWEWEVFVEELGTTVFVIPSEFGGRTGTAGVKNGEDRLLILNSVAREAINAQRGKHPEWVFPSPKGNGPYFQLNNSNWKNARLRAANRYQETFKREAPVEFRNLRVHDCKHTFGRRLRSTGVSFEDRQVLLGHSNGSVTTHYSPAEIQGLIDVAERVCLNQKDAPTVTLIRSLASHAKLTQQS